MSDKAKASHSLTNPMGAVFHHPVPKAVSATVLIAAVDAGKEEDLYPVMAYLRDTCVPSLRPLYAPMQALCFAGCKAAAVVKYDMDDSTSRYELVVQRGHLETRIKSTVHRQTPTLGEFTKYLTEIPE